MDDQQRNGGRRSGVHVMQYIGLMILTFSVIFGTIVGLTVLWDLLTLPQYRRKWVASDAYRRGRRDERDQNVR